MSLMCSVGWCTKPAEEESPPIGPLCPAHSEACEKARDGASWTQAFIDAGPNAPEEDVVAQWFSEWCAEQAQ